MNKILTGIVLALCFQPAVGASNAPANAVAKHNAGKHGAAGVNVVGTYKLSLGDLDDRLRVTRVGKDKIWFHLNAYWVYGEGENKGANVGDAEGTIPIRNNVAVWNSPYDETHHAKITFKFKPRSVTIDQDGPDFSQGFGHNVDASGTYKKVSNRIITEVDERNNSE